MRFWPVPVALLAAGACNPADTLLVDATYVSGGVYREGVPVEGAIVHLSSGASDTTDAQGRYVLDPGPGIPEECSGDAFAEVSRDSRRDLRLYTDESDARITIPCGKTTLDADFSFFDDLWYSGLTIEGESGVALPDSVTIELGAWLYPTYEFLVSRVAQPGYVHADSVTWVWDGDTRIVWQLGGMRLVDRTDDGADGCWPGQCDVRALEAVDTGTVELVATVEDSPFSDTVVVVVE